MAHFLAAADSKPTARPVGIHVLAIAADFSDFPRQVEEATEFLRAEAEQVRRLCTFLGVEGVTLDFGVEWRHVAV